MHSEYISQTTTYVKKTLADAETGHDWFHVYRVWQLSKTILQTESADKLTVELGALLHDIADAKFFDNDEAVGPRKAHAYLTTLGVDRPIVEHVTNIVAHISFKGGNQKQQFYSKELDIVQDADRLDAMGAIGIARAFNYGGFTKRAMYDPAIPPKLDMTKEEYKNNKGPTINHFYEKLLLLKDRMNTQTGKQIAQKRHAFMEQYLSQFYAEWDAKA